MKTSKAGIDLIKSFEGCELKAYLCSSKKPTIGWGHTKTVKESDIGKKTISVADAERLLNQDLFGFEAGVFKLVEVPINENQFSALVSLAFNIGLVAFEGSTLLKRLNAKDYAAAAEQFAVWRMGGPKGKKVVLAGLVRRRASEKALFLTLVK